MRWKGINHMPVENDSGRLCGLLTKTHMEKFRYLEEGNENIVVEEIMTKDVVVVSPDTKISEAKEIMIKHNIGCLPVIQDKSLVGIITIKDLIEAE
jgi:CBS domain-containing protein